MKHIRYIIVFLISLLVGFGSGTCLKVLYEIKTVQPYSWHADDPPIVINCYGSDFSKLQMHRAIEYWRLRHHKIVFYDHTPPPEVCQVDWMRGAIILRKVNSFANEGTLASTRRYTSGIRMLGSEISYLPGSYNLNLINEHELGHALGYSHLDKEGHIMHPLYHKMGRDF